MVTAIWSSSARLVMRHRRTRRRSKPSRRRRSGNGWTPSLAGQEQPRPPGLLLGLYRFRVHGDKFKIFFLCPVARVSPIQQWSIVPRAR